MKAELAAIFHLSGDEPGGVEVADCRIAVMRQRSIRPLLLVPTSDVVGADRGARVHEVAEVNVVDDGGVVDCPNACS